LLTPAARVNIGLRTFGGMIGIPGIAQAVHDEGPAAGGWNRAKKI
jgi:hypothetical protein